MVLFPGAEVDIGTDDRRAAYDNERPRHRARIGAFAIDAAPVTNGAYVTFIEDGGYVRPELWSAAGRRWLARSRAEAPMYWFREGAAWLSRAFDRAEPLDPLQPVSHVSWWEADAFARWAGKRLPTETEWEAAATWDPIAGCKRSWPWGGEAPHRGLANVDQLAFDAEPVGAHPRNVSPIGCAGMIGNLWEWTASDFGPYPGYRSFPYPEYSEVFFGTEHKVLRGGSWATRGAVARATFRNWDFPDRRQIFSGFRCARDA
jgi:iron(II)-dependent oxidoreductase